MDCWVEGGVDEEQEARWGISISFSFSFVILHGEQVSREDLLLASKSKDSVQGCDVKMRRCFQASYKLLLMSVTSYLCWLPNTFPFHSQLVIGILSFFHSSSRWLPCCVIYYNDVTRELYMSYNMKEGCWSRV